MLLCIFSIAYLHGQENIYPDGGTATGSGGSVTYTVGQVTYCTFTGTNGSVAHGVQQPYEISVVTEIENSEDSQLNLMFIPVLRLDHSCLLSDHQSIIT